MITVIDYGMGNLRSVSKALESLGAEVKVSSLPADVIKADKLIFPGVGAFSDCMDEINKRNLVDPIKQYIESRRPFLGICMGLQLLFESSQEAPGIKGLNVLKGRVKKFDIPGLKVPHIGWNQVELTEKGKASALFAGIEDKEFFYFVHSYYAQAEDESLILSKTQYGLNFCSSINKENIFATQFHPEKSQKIGLQLLDNFLKLDLK
jgi:imidazole glycerol phosphate synthase glutamine amidotransferase subunit